MNQLARFLLSQFNSEHISTKIIKELKSMTTAPNDKLLFELFEVARAKKFLLMSRANHGKNICEKKNIRHVSFWDECYPVKLRSLEKPPWNIFYAGTLLRADVFTMGIVGTRRPNKYGHELVERILLGALCPEFQTVSGLALGIDALSHQCSLARGIKTCAILGSSLDEIYPRENAEIAIEIIKAGGALMSEYPPTTPALKHNFPWRNRIIAALGDCLWVPQACRRSGTRHTLEHANALGVPIVTSPGDVFSELSEMPLDLLRNGCHPIADGKDLMAVVSGRSF